MRSIILVLLLGGSLAACGNAAPTSSPGSGEETSPTPSASVTQTPAVSTASPEPATAQVPTLAQLADKTPPQLPRLGGLPCKTYYNPRAAEREFPLIAEQETLLGTEVNGLLGVNCGSARPEGGEGAGAGVTITDMVAGSQMTTGYDAFQATFADDVAAAGLVVRRDPQDLPEGTICAELSDQLTNCLVRIDHYAVNFSGSGSDYAQASMPVFLDWILP